MQKLFPEVFTEGRIDFDKLKEALGEGISTDRERYGLSWAGKREGISSESKNGGESALQACEQPLITCPSTRRIAPL